MSAIAPLLSRYVSHMRALGRQFDLPHGLLCQCDRFLASRGNSDLTAEAFSAWAASMAPLSANGRRLRMQVVYRFCRWRQRTEPSCFVPNPVEFPRLQSAPPPYIFGETEIARLLCFAEAPRRGASSLCRHVMRLAVVLLYTAGLRRGELLRLTLEDYDLQTRTLRIRETKFHKSRLVPLSADAGGEVERFLAHRRHLGLPGGAQTPLMLVHRVGGFRAYSADGFANSMRKLFLAAGIRTRTGRAPRVHDLRFTFAVHALCRWYRAGLDVGARLPLLAAYMGHASVVSTQYYLSHLETVAQDATERFERHCGRFLATESNNGGAR